MGLLQGIVGFYIAYELGYIIGRIVPIGLSMAGAGRVEYRLQLKLPYTACFTVDVFIA